jgi:glutathione S-transferase
MEHRDLYPALVNLLALLVYFWMLIRAGGARAKHKIEAPATTGHPEFERKLRVRQNSLELLIMFIPSLWIFCLTIQVLVGAALGLIFVIGRIIYALSYAAAPEKRGPGFGLSIIPTLILLLGGLVGVIRLLVLDM